MLRTRQPPWPRGRAWLLHSLGFLRWKIFETIQTLSCAAPLGLSLPTVMLRVNAQFCSVSFPAKTLTDPLATSGSGSAVADRERVAVRNGAFGYSGIVIPCFDNRCWLPPGYRVIKTSADDEGPSIQCPECGIDRGG